MAYGALSTIFDQPGSAFVFLRPGIKFPPSEEGWQNKGHSFQEAAAHKGNVGLMAGRGHIGLDKDDPAAFAGLELPDTTSWETRPGRLGLWFCCNDRTPEVLAKYGFKADQAQIYLYDPKQIERQDDKGRDLFKHVGEIKLERTYQVIPPSWKMLEDGQRADYRLLNEIAPSEISLDALLSGLLQIGLSFKEKDKGSRLEENAGKLEAKGREARQKRAETDEQRTRRYAEAALRDEVLILAGMPDGSRNRQLNKSAFVLGQFVAAGVLDEDEVIQELSWAARCAGLPGDEIERTISSGLEAGTRHPREIPERSGPCENAPKGTEARSESNGLTVIEAIKALAEVCDHATSRDGQGFSKFDREEHEDLIENAISGGILTPKQEKKAYQFLKKYKKQLRGLGISYDEIGHIVRSGGDADYGLAEINERIPDWIAEHKFKTVSDTERLYRYVHGVYLDDGETVLKSLIENEFGDITSNRLVQDIIGKVKRRTYVDRDLFNHKNILNVKNGLLNLETLQLLPHTPDYLSTAQIDVFYNPEAKAPKIQKFLKEAAQSQDIALIEEIIGWLLWPDYNVHKAVMLLGPGRNGKGTLLRLITAFLGSKSISNVTLQDLVADRFAKADLYGKLANIGGDLPSKDLSDTAAFRNLTGGDDNRAQEKYRPAFSFRNKAKLMFSANVLPRSPDDTYAFYSRWILIEFLHIFDLQKGTADPDLDAKLQTPEELSGLLNIALAGLERLRANGWRFTYDKTVEDVEIMYKRNANPVYAFLLDECEQGEATDYIEKTLFYNHFKEYAIKHGIRPLSSTKFGELLKDQSEIPVSSFRPWVEYGDRPRCWQGVRFKHRASMCQSIPSIVLPTPSSRENGIEDENENEIKDREGRDCRNPGRYGLTRTSTANEGIKADLLQAEEERKAKEAHAGEQAAKYIKKRFRSYSDMAGSVPYDTSSSEAEKICRSFRGQLMKGIAPRLDFLIKDTGLSINAIEGYLSSASWVLKDDSSPGGIVVYLPVEAST